MLQPESVTAQTTHPKSFYAPSMFNLHHFPFWKRKLVFLSRSLCICVLLYCQRFPGGEKISVSLSSHTSCQIYGNTKLLIGPALGFPPGSETAISGPPLGSERERGTLSRLPLSWQVSLYSSDTCTHTVTIMDKRLLAHFPFLL